VALSGGGPWGDGAAPMMGWALITPVLSVTRGRRKRAVCQALKALEKSSQMARRGAHQLGNREHVFDTLYEVGTWHKQ